MICQKAFPILTTKKVAFNTMIAELKWFLKGETNIRTSSKRRLSYLDR